MLVSLSIGHTGRYPFTDRGTSTVDGLQEVTMARRYAAAMEQELWALGHSVVILSDGTYPERWARADSYGADVYLDCHVNGGTAHYGLLVHDYRSTRGKTLAQSCAVELYKVRGDYAGASLVRTGQPDSNGQPRDGDWSEAFHCIRGVRAVGLVLEPFFSRADIIGRDVANLDRIGQALARGVHGWAG